MKLDDYCKRYTVKRLLNVSCEIFGTRSYGGEHSQARASFAI